MRFVENAEEIAASAMLEINPLLEKKYANLIGLLKKNPLAAPASKGKKALPFGEADYIKKHAVSYSNSRNPRKPKPPSTIPDEMVSVVLGTYFHVPTERLDQAKKEHLLSMAAENIVGDLLERYLAEVMEPLGWIWCSGSLVKAVDFVKPPMHEGALWTLLQVKNRDNSENSSSSAIRNGTDIKKWFRTFSKTGDSNWEDFPDKEVQKLVSEENFRKFVRGYLSMLKKNGRAETSLPLI